MIKDLNILWVDWHSKFLINNIKNGLLKDYFHTFKFPLIQYKVVSHPEALEIAMKLEAYPIGDWGMAQVQTWLVALTIQLAELTKWKEKWEQVWCVNVELKATLTMNSQKKIQYLVTRAPNPLSGGGYCEIFKTWGHHPPNFPILQKYQSMPRGIYFVTFASQ
jgi:hypothetical protein